MGYGQALDFALGEHLAFEPTSVDGQLEAPGAQVFGEAFTGAMGSPKPMARAVGPSRIWAISGRPACSAAIAASVFLTTFTSTLAGRRARRSSVIWATERPR